MSEIMRIPKFKAADMYAIVRRLYSSIPFALSAGGGAFPAWHFCLELTRRCNLRCKMCHYINWLESAPVREQIEGELSTDEWLRIIDRIPRFSLITFTGGECFLRNDFMDILGYASSKTRTHLITNATMITEEVAEQISSIAAPRLGFAGFNFAGVSIEGPAEIHDSIRQKSGAFEKSMTGIRRMKRAGRRAGKSCPKVHITTVIQDENVDVLHLLPGLCADAGADVLNLITETRMYDLPEIGETDPRAVVMEKLRWPKISRAKLASAMDRTIAEARALGVQLRLPRMPRKSLLDYYDPDGAGHNLDLAEFECRAPWNFILIGRRGEVFACWIRKIGSVRVNSLKELWNSSPALEFRRELKNGIFDICPGCCFFEHKRGRACR